jgi:hypothetical protein
MLFILICNYAIYYTLFLWVYSAVGLRLDFGIQYSMVSDKTLSTGYQSLTLIPLHYIPIQTNHSYHLPLSTGYQSLTLIPPCRSHWKTLLHIVLSSTPRHYSVNGNVERLK